MSHASRALDVQTALVSSARAQAFASIPQSRKDRLSNTDWNAFLRSEMNAKVDDMAAPTATPIFITSDVMDAIDIMAEDFQSEPLMPEDFLMPRFTLVFERPLPVRGNSSHEQVSDYRDSEDTDNIDVLSASLINGYRDPAMPSKMTKVDETSLVEDPTQADTITLRGYCPPEFRFPAIGFMDSFGLTAEESVLDTDTHRWLQVCLRLLQDKVFISTITEADRPARKRAKRAGIQSKVNVITLPSRSYEGKGQEGHTYSVRWMVRGHWRNQPYGPKGAPTHYRQKWIHGFVKGPDGAPFVAKHNVGKVAA